MFKQNLNQFHKYFKDFNLNAYAVEPWILVGILKSPEPLDVKK